MKCEHCGTALNGSLDEDLTGADGFRPDVVRFHTRERCLEAQLATEREKSAGLGRELPRLKVAMSDAVSAVQKERDVALAALDQKLALAVTALEQIRDQRYAGLTIDFAAKTLREIGALP